MSQPFYFLLQPHDPCGGRGRLLGQAMLCWNKGYYKHGTDHLGLRAFPHTLPHWDFALSAKDCFSGGQRQFSEAFSFSALLWLGGLRIKHNSRLGRQEGPAALGCSCPQREEEASSQPIFPCIVLSCSARYVHFLFNQGLGNNKFKKQIFCLKSIPKGIEKSETPK